jgi:tRNA(fMet)-specific endonuclease VapC
LPGNTARFIDLAARVNWIGANDLWIAATALANGFALVTSNPGDFSRVTGLEVESF